ncbi:MAG: nicotinate (nicotinamide) nucleotide adenylyltransferase [Bacteroidales bacterium]|nr:nicotinate (nicotinamide) nucleotide adenylyltransferase [Candidatus Physcousia equi]
MHIAIYGGSFNPIHRGHAKLAKWIIQQDIVDQLWLLVSPLNPLKEPNPELLPDEERLRLALLAVSDDTCSDRIIVSDFEMKMPRPSYTIDTLRALRTTHPQHRFSLLIGADNWLSFPRWRDPDEIIAHHDIFVYPRPGYQVDETTLPTGVHYLAEAPVYDISSTQLRHAIAHPDNTFNPSDHLSPSVWAEIQTRGFWT